MNGIKYNIQNINIRSYFLIISNQYIPMKSQLTCKILEYRELR